MYTQQRTYHDFIRRICQWGGLTEWEAEEAASAILCAIEQRLEVAQKGEPNWVPRGLRSVLASCPRHEHAPPSSIGRETLTRVVERDLDLHGEAADAVVHAVFAAARTLVSANEAQSIAVHLPDDLRALWERPVFDRALGQTPLREHADSQMSEVKSQKSGEEHAREENIAEGRAGKA